GRFSVAEHLEAGGSKPAILTWNSGGMLNQAAQGSPGGPREFASGGTLEEGAELKVTKNLSHGFQSRTRCGEFEVPQRTTLRRLMLSNPLLKKPALTSLIACRCETAARTSTLQRNLLKKPKQKKTHRQILTVILTNGLRQVKITVWDGTYGRHRPLWDPVRIKYEYKMDIMTAEFPFHP
ncbi:hypothetical protein GOODEAATRI_025433, partial [Goodea atripinnis]